jgi:hypothetical protein
MLLWEQLGVDSVCFSGEPHSGGKGGHVGHSPPTGLGGPVEKMSFFSNSPYDQSKYSDPLIYVPI